jgi:hypothetical protein
MLFVRIDLNGDNIPSFNVATIVIHEIELFVKTLNVELLRKYFEYLRIVVSELKQ